MPYRRRRRQKSGDEVGLEIIFWVIVALIAYLVIADALSKNEIKRRPVGVVTHTNTLWIVTVEDPKNYGPNQIMEMWENETPDISINNALQYRH